MSQKPNKMYLYVKYVKYILRHPNLPFIFLLKFDKYINVEVLKEKEVPCKH